MADAHLFEGLFWGCELEPPRFRLGNHLFPDHWRDVWTFKFEAVEEITFKTAEFAADRNSCLYVERVAMVQPERGGEYDQ